MSTEHLSDGAYVDNPEYGFASLTLEQHARQHGLEHNENCEVCVLIRRCRKLVASYEAKVEDLARETRRTSEQSKEIEHLREALRELLADVSAKGWHVHPNTIECNQCQKYSRIDALLGAKP
jgi:predicted RNase H-like nuclease (RuvC/YqgF family)